MSRRAFTHTLKLGLLVSFVVLALSGCGGGGGKPLSEEFGSMPAGRYSTTEFKPALSFEVGEGWRVGTPEQETVVGVSQAGPAKGIYFANPPKVHDPTDPDEIVSAPEDSEEWLAWFLQHPRLQTSEPESVEVGGIEGEQFDVTTAPLPEDYNTQDCGHAVPLWPEPSGYHWCASEGKARMIVLEEVDGEPVIIDISAPPGQHKEFLPEAQEVLDTVEWEDA
jgi:hypothetical protein